MLAHGARCLCSAAGAWKGLLAQGLEQRRFHTTSRAPELGAKSVKVTQGGKRLEVVFDDGQHIGLSAEYLRVMSPSADTRDRKDARGQQRVVSGRRRVAIIGAEHVGSYALRLKFDDLHHAGIYSWSMLKELHENKWAHMRHYIRQLRERGLTRDPATGRQN